MQQSKDGFLALYTWRELAGKASHHVYHSLHCPIVKDWEFVVTIAREMHNGLPLSQTPQARQTTVLDGLVGNLRR